MRLMTTAILVGLLMALMGCEGAALVGEPGGAPGDPGGGETPGLLMGTALRVGDEGAFAGGMALCRYPRQDSSLRVERYRDYTYGTREGGELGQEFWDVTLAHNQSASPLDETYVIDLLDYGAVQVNGTDLERQTAPPDVEGEVPVALRNYVRYFARPYARTTFVDGSAVVHADAPLMVGLRGHVLALEAAGSDEVSAVQATFATRPFASIQRLVSGEDTLAFERERPAAVDRELQLQFDAVLQPGEAFVALLPAPPLEPGGRVDVPGGLTAVLHPQEATSTLSIAPEDLATLKSRYQEVFGGEAASYTLLFMQAFTDLGTVETTDPASGASRGMPLVQLGQTFLSIRLE